jgi:signal transduction histidine kinase
MSVPPPSAPHPLARRIHDRVLQLIGSALMKTELCEQLDRLGRGDEIPANLGELREVLEEAVVELRAIMADLRQLSASTGESAAEAESLKNRAA